MIVAKLTSQSSADLVGLTSLATSPTDAASLAAFKESLAAAITGGAPTSAQTSASSFEAMLKSASRAPATVGDDTIAQLTAAFRALTGGKAATGATTMVGDTSVQTLLSALTTVLGKSVGASALGTAFTSLTGATGPTPPTFDFKTALSTSLSTAGAGGSTMSTTELLKKLISLLTSMAVGDVGCSTTTMADDASTDLVATRSSAASTVGESPATAGATAASNTVSGSTGSGSSGNALKSSKGKAAKTRSTNDTGVAKTTTTPAISELRTSHTGKTGAKKNTAKADKSPPLQTSSSHALGSTEAKHIPPFDKANVGTAFAALASPKLQSYRL